MLAEFGERLRLARIRRGIQTETLAERASISRMTLNCSCQTLLTFSYFTQHFLLLVLETAD